MQELLDVAKALIELRYKKGSHSVACALRTKSGTVYTGISINGQKLNICAEWTALGKFFEAGEQEIEMIVAVHRTVDGQFEIFPPCALCRELCVTYFPDVKVIIGENEVVVASDLLPHAWVKK